MNTFETLIEATISQSFVDSDDLRYEKGIEYIRQRFTSPPFNFQWNDRYQYRLFKRSEFRDYESIILAQRKIGENDFISLYQMGLRYGLPEIACGYPELCCGINLHESISFIRSIIVKNKNPFKRINAKRHPLAYFSFDDYQSPNDPVTISNLNDENSHFIQYYKIFNFYEELCANPNIGHAECVIRTLEFWSKLTKGLSTYINSPDEDAITQLKLEFLDSNQLSMTDWAQII